LIARGAPHLSRQEIAAYDAPYPSPEYKAGAQVFPALVPVSPDMEGVEVSRAAAAFWANEWRGKSFMAIGMADPVLDPPAMMRLNAMIKGCPPPMEIEGGGHFVQEWGESIARAAPRRATTFWRPLGPQAAIAVALPRKKNSGSAGCE
jgi:haloalkane dehalogenase